MDPIDQNEMPPVDLEPLMTEAAHPSWDTTPPRYLPLQREFSQLPVTALCFSSSGDQSLLLAAQDTGISIFDAASSEVVAQVLVFAEQTVHGISVYEERRVLVWGSKHVAFFTLDGLEESKQDFKPEVLRVDAPDWVYAGKISPYDSTIAVLATAHNEAVRVHIDEVTRRLRVEEVISPARPILYSAELTWLDPSSVLIAAGTAFGEILLWKSHFSEPQSSHEMLFVFTGHEGSIFGMAISPLLSLPGSSEDIRLLASCSDDRTVRVWDITERDEEREKYDFVSARETGFSEILSNADQPKLEGGEPVAVGMGHLSRIWGVEIGEMNHAGEVDVWTFGEDSTTWRWRLSLEKREAKVNGDLRFVKMLSYHNGKHLWSHATTKVKGKGFLATGGADGRISLIKTGSDSRPSSDMVTLDCQQLCPETIKKVVSKKAKPEVFGRFDFVSQDQILVNTSNGRLLVGTYSEEGLEWQQITLGGGLEDEVKQCYVLKGIATGVAILGTTTGNVYLYQNGAVSLVESFPKKIVDINVLAIGKDSTVDLFIHIFGTACPSYIRLHTQTGQLLSTKQVKGLDERFICTSAGLLGPYIIMGSRHGWLSLLELQGDTYSQIITFPSPTQDAITCIVSLPTSPDSTHTLFLCTSRDGCYRIYCLTSQPHLHVDLVHHTTLPFGPMIESAFFTSHSPPQLILTGFRSKNFIVWNESLREERLSVECGGAHRSFAFHHSSTDEGVIRLTFNRASKLSIYSQLRPEATPLKRGTHGREIREISYGPRYIATGGEDTTIRIFEKHPRNRCLAHLKAHVSGLQKLKWLELTNLLFSSGGNEELFVWRVEPLQNTTYSGLGVVQEAVFDDKSPVGDLRIMDFDLECTFSSEMTPHRRWNPDGGAIVTMAFSSSVLARYRYHPDSGFQLLAKGSYTGACLTQTKHLGTLNDDKEGFPALTASTDGHVAVWKSDLQEKTFTIQHVLKIHQSSIKCLEVSWSNSVRGRSSPEGDRYIITGGDDNALGMTILDVDLQLVSHGVVRNAHAASINGLMTRLHWPEYMEIFTISNDQRLKTWQFDLGKGEEKRRLRLVGDVYSGVADPGDLEGLDNERIAVVGVGVEVWGEDSPERWDWRERNKDLAQKRNGDVVRGEAEEA